MIIELTESAVRELQRRKLEQGDRIYLVYDVEGCGCAVSGVAALWIANGPVDDGVSARSNTDIAMGYLNRQKVFFEDQVRLDYRADQHALILKSDNQIYSANVGISDRRNAAPTLPFEPQ